MENLISSAGEKYYELDKYNIFIIVENFNNSYQKSFKNIIR